MRWQGAPSLTLAFTLWMPAMAEITARPHLPQSMRKASHHMLEHRCQSCGVRQYPQNHRMAESMWLSKTAYEGYTKCNWVCNLQVPLWQRRASWPLKCCHQAHLRLQETGRHRTS